MGDPLCFWLAGTLAVLASLGVILCVRTPLYTALCLGATLLSTAVLFLNLHAHLAAAVQVMIYAGAILVLIVFAIMLLNLRGGTPERIPGAARPIGLAAGLAILGALASVLLRAGPLAAPPAVGPEFGTPAEIGRTLLGAASRWVYPFELVSVLLLAAIVGAVALGKTPPEKK